MKWGVKHLKLPIKLFLLNIKFEQFFYSILEIIEYRYAVGNDFWIIQNGAHWTIIEVITSIKVIIYWVASVGYSVITGF